MKKYITIAALLAAGTAFANAAQPEGIATTETLWTMDFGSSYEGGYSFVSTEAGEGCSAGSVWDVGSWVTEEGVTTAGNHRVHLAGCSSGVSWDDDFMFSITFTLGETISASNDWPAVAEVRGNGTALRFGPYTGSSNVVDVDGNLAKNDWEGISVSAGGTYTAKLYVIEGGVSLYIDDVLAASGSLAEGTTGNITDIALGGDTGSYYRINETVSNISMSKLTVVPEPSAFGLLAGLGALALVASRRRRK